MIGLLPLQRYFQFSGRSGRAEFWQFFGIVLAAVFVAFLIDSAVGNVQAPVLTMIAIAAIIAPYYAVFTRRLHDRGWSGWWLVAHAGATLFSVLIARAADANSYTAVGDGLAVFARGIGWGVRGLEGLLLYQAIRVGDEFTNRYGPPVATSQPVPTIRDIADKVRVQFEPSAGSVHAPLPHTPPSSVVDPIEQIERLARLRDAGALTDDEFSRQKAAYLATLEASAAAHPANKGMGQ